MFGCPFLYTGVGKPGCNSLFYRSIPEERKIDSGEKEGLGEFLKQLLKDFLPFPVLLKAGKFLPYSKVKKEGKKRKRKRGDG